MKRKGYTYEQVILAVKNSTSIRQVLNKLGLKEAGGNYSSIHKLINKLEIDTKHFSGQSWNKGIKFGPKRPIEDYLSNQQTINSHKLRKRLINDKIFPYKCSNCHLSQWLDQPIPLELEHIDGNHNNNSLDNLTLLCPNCHAMTSTYRGKNIGKK